MFSIHRMLFLALKKVRIVKITPPQVLKTLYLKIIKRQFYRELDQEEETCDGDQPVAEESKQF